MKVVDGISYMDTSEAKEVWGLRTRRQAASYCRRYKDSIGAFKDSRRAWQIPVSAMPPISIGALRKFLFDYLKAQNGSSDFSYGEDTQNCYWRILYELRYVFLREHCQNCSDSGYVISELGWSFLLDKNHKEKRPAITLSPSFLGLSVSLRLDC